jgi:hypothetical protein
VLISPDCFHLHKDRREKKRKREVACKDRLTEVSSTYSSVNKWWHGSSSLSHRFAVSHMLSVFLYIRLFCMIIYSISFSFSGPLCLTSHYISYQNRVHVGVQTSVGKWGVSLWQYIIWTYCKTLYYRKFFNPRLVK